MVPSSGGRREDSGIASFAVAISAIRVELIDDMIMMAMMIIIVRWIVRGSDDI